MNPRLLALLLSTLCLCGTASAQTSGTTPRVTASTPAWLPRGAFLGTSLRGGAVVPQVRLQWQLMFYEARRDALGVFIEPEAALLAVAPSGLTADPFGSVPPGSLSRLGFGSLLVSIGYTAHMESGVEWGFQIGTGPAWYQARFQGSSKDQESYWVGLLDGHARVGYRVGGVGMGVAVGYGDPYNYKRASLAHTYVGGLQLGLYADWR